MWRRFPYTAVTLQPVTIGSSPAVCWPVRHGRGRGRPASLFARGGPTLRHLCEGHRRRPKVSAEASPVRPVTEVPLRRTIGSRYNTGTPLAGVTECPTGEDRLDLDSSHCWARESPADYWPLSL